MIRKKPSGPCRMSLLAAFFFCAGTALASAGMTVAEQPNQKGEKVAMDEILKIEDSAMEQWRQGNPMKWAEISGDEIIYIDPGLSAPLVGKAAYVQYLEPLRGKIFYDQSEYVRPQVVLYGNTAVLTYNYHSLRKDPNGRLERTSFWNTTEVYRLIEGQWRIVHTHWSYIKHHLPESLEVKIPVRMREGESLEGIAAEIMRLETGAMERWRKGDPSGFLDISAPEVTYFDTGTPARLNGFGELKKEYDQRVGKIHYDVMEFVNPHLQLFEDTAVLFYPFFSTTLNPDGTIKSRTPWNCTEVYAKTAGEWKIVHTHWSYINGRREDSGI
jgi:ketosteroid isomerase-like protein